MRAASLLSPLRSREPDNHRLRERNEIATRWHFASSNAVGKLRVPMSDMDPQCNEVLLHIITQ
jgi:hypothetical protein